MNLAGQLPFEFGASPAEFFDPDAAKRAIDETWWPDRCGLPHEVREFEAESVSYLVCIRLGIHTPSEAYLADYLDQFEHTPQISLDCVLKSAGLIEQMGRKRLQPRKEKPKTNT